MIDLVSLLIAAGDGGFGRVSFRREKYVPKGGPDGGRGGRGGNVIVRATRSHNTLQHLSSVKKIEARPGQPGGKKKMFGADAEDVVVEVPVGTRIWLLAENKASRRRRQRTTLEYSLPRGDVRFQQYWVEKEGQGIPQREPDEVVWLDDETKTAVDRHQLTEKFRELTKESLIELNEDGQEIILVQGGFGGRGNEAFKGPDKTTPMEAEYGTFGEQKMVVFELRLLADVGLVGLPNAGKSTLISVLTQARPKVGAYPFTTLEPHLGILQLSKGNGAQNREGGVRDLVIADIPGLIEGASQGKGLGHLFLRHVEHCQLLLFILYLDEPLVFDESTPLEQKVSAVVDQYTLLEKELAEYSQELAQKPRQLVLHKSDLYPAELQEAIVAAFEQKKLPLLVASAATKEGIAELVSSLHEHFSHS